MFAILGLVLIAVGAWGLLTGKVMAGSRGFKANTYTREDNPVLFYLFVAMYVLAGVFVVMSKPWPWAGS
ncbi:MAG: hypothetical protein H3C29_08790 [Simplicispira suum]|jgi:hypothetical protein|uniref:hypothetical protein n=1 Tax=Simplicispira suum TaxID=2109915 RepID=UPI001C6CCBEE|nr:hypothetical protein [Simplicispira suum]MBW7833299.1 hypothetical protein [Simplicispira suum]